jgi:Glyoxalase-like domain
VTIVASRISHTTVDSGNAFALSEWWKTLLGYTDVPGDPNLPGHHECMILDPVTGHRMLFIDVPEPKAAKNRVHFDLAPTDCFRDAEVERVKSLGATVIADRRNANGSGWVLFSDPEGNEFCVVRSDAERAAHE